MLLLCNFATSFSNRTRTLPPSANPWPRGDAGAARHASTPLGRRASGPLPPWLSALSPVGFLQSHNDEEKGIERCITTSSLPDSPLLSTMTHRHNSPYGSSEGSGEAVSRFPSQPFLLIPVPQLLQPRARAQDKRGGRVYSRTHGSSSSSKYRDSGRRSCRPSLSKTRRHSDEDPAVRAHRRRHRAAPDRFPLLGVMLRASHLHVPRHRTQAIGGGQSRQLHFWEADTNPSRAASEGSVHYLPTPPIPMPIFLPRGRTMECVHICSASLITRYDDVWCWRALRIQG
ncbi:hypothetical protein B0T18DRAFT_58997 [Schizothecium vesticola]|uniref:Uncharacterized protein n=1 Tax=Schizothecium vesticola TaxID=314040 RepID=A0AA40F4G2_9PEZI|nr:hypothetical protein B0T18DRAFT_58997 [Schizothecium vesticola]